MGKARLLVVEDDIDIGNMLKIYFGGMDYEVDVAIRGSDALERTKQVLPHHRARTPPASQRTAARSHSATTPAPAAAKSREHRIGRGRLRPSCRARSPDSPD